MRCRLFLTRRSSQDTVWRLEAGNRPSNRAAQVLETRKSVVQARRSWIAALSAQRGMFDNAKGSARERVAGLSWRGGGRRRCWSVCYRERGDDEVGTYESDRKKGCGGEGRGVGKQVGLERKDTGSVLQGVMV